MSTVVVSRRHPRMHLPDRHKRDRDRDRDRDGDRDRDRDSDTDMTHRKAGPVMKEITSISKAIETATCM
jgi:hypothetical protein